MLAGLEDMLPHLPEPSSAIACGVADPLICHKRHSNIWQLLSRQLCDLYLLYIKS